MSITPARRGALRMLRAVRRGALVDHVAAEVLPELEPRDRSFAHELVYGTLRLRGRLDHLLDGLVRRGLDSVQPDVRDVLRMGAYQLLEMGGVPSYAAVSQSVDLARAAGQPRAAGMVNGVLQALARGERLPPFPAWEEDPGGYLVTWGSHPRWLVERWLERYGAEAARALVEADNRRPEVYLRLVGMDVEPALTRLAVDGVAAEAHPLASGSLRLAAAADVARALASVPAVVQDPAASLVVAYAGLPPGGRMADLCAAPGGKAVTLAAAALPPMLAEESAGYVAAGDLSHGRLLRVRENARRLGALPLGLLVADARTPPLRPLGAVLVDAPCTGTGTLRRHPDGRWRLGPQDLVALAALQTDILAGAATAVAPGGVLVYATCSLEPEENEDQVDRFLRDRPDFRLEPAPSSAPVDERGFLRVLPQVHGVDGAFAARMVRGG